jgi:glycerol-3-phosphate dehydrogenase
MPISAAVAALLSGKMSVETVIGSLLTRPFKAEV